MAALYKKVMSQGQPKKLLDQAREVLRVRRQIHCVNRRGY
jgi:hypothetical protein